MVKTVPAVEMVASKNKTFEPYNRALHIISTAKRVNDFANLCNDKSINDELRIIQLGYMMRESQISNRDKYDCSGPNLNELT